MPTVTKPPILDETGQAIVTALGNVSIRPQIVDNLTTADANKALSANMGNSLKTNIDGLSDVIMLMGNTLSSNVNAIKPSLGMDSNTSQTLIDVSDANTVDKTCVAYAYNCSNLPPLESNYGYLTTLVASSSIAKQYYTPYNSKISYERLKYNNSWSDWYPVGNSLSDNLVKRIVEGGNTTVNESNIIYANGNNSDTYFRFYTGIGLPSGKYRISCFVYGFANDSQCYTYYLNNNPNFPILVVKNGYCYVDLYNTSYISESDGILIDDANRSPNHSHYITAFSVRAFS